MKFFKPFLYSVIIIGVFGTCPGTERKCDFHRLSRRESFKVRRLCGKALVDMKRLELKISFGNEAIQGQFPWAVSSELSKPSYIGACTGTVISNYHILTAAHCFQGDGEKDEFKIKDYNVRENCKVLAGTPCVYREPLNKWGIDPSINCSRTEFKKPRELSVSRVIIPKDSVAFVPKCFRERLLDCPKSEYSDLAIIELSKPLESKDSDIRPICLPKPDMKTPISFEFYGYGDVAESSEREPSNQQLFWGTDYGYHLHYSGNVIIVPHSRKKNVSTCQGDSGGGLTATINSRNYLIGINSAGYGYCNKVKFPIQYSTDFFNVAAKHDFICYYTGICPSGYNKYIDANYPKHPEEVAYLSNGDGGTLIGPENTKPVKQICKDIGKKCGKYQSTRKHEKNKNYLC